MSPQLPSLSPRKVIQALQRAGFALRRVKGSHHFCRNPDRPDLLVVVPYHAKDIKRPVLHSILKQAGMSVENFIALLWGRSVPYSAAADNLSRSAGPANSRSWPSEGTWPRASATLARSMSARIAPGSSPASATISPQGATITEWP